MTTMSSKSTNQRLISALQEARAKLEAVKRTKQEPIAIIGMGCRFPLASSPESFWQLLRSSQDVITQVPANRWDIDAYYDPDPDIPGKIYTHQGGFLEQIDQFDAQFFGISPREAVKLDPQQRLLLEVSWEALERAGQAPSELFGSATGVFVGISTFDYTIRLLEVDEQIDAYVATGSALSAAAGRLSYLLGLAGPSMAVDTACSSSLVAVHLGMTSLRQQECNLALVGGVNVLLEPKLSISFAKARMLAPDGRCKTFDAAANGYVRSEGCGVIVLKRLSDALAEGDHILAVIRGSAVNQDGASGGLTVPSGPSQEAVIRQALKNAGISPAQVSYIEAHGTGTSLGDPIEMDALERVFGHEREEPLLVGSVKTNIGHLEPAAGIAGLIKVVLSLQHGEIPPHLHFKTPNPHISWHNFPVKVPTERTPWDAKGEQSRVRRVGSSERGGGRMAGVSSFGVTGTNAHVVLEEAPAQELVKADVERPLHLLTLSAKTEIALQELVSRYAAHLGEQEADLADVCFTANTGRSHFNHRLSVVAANKSEMMGKLTAFGGRAGDEVSGLFQKTVTQAPQVAFLFTGQGSQYVGMGQELYQTQPTFRKVLDECDDLLREMLEQPLRKLLFVGSQAPRGHREGLLNETAYTQVALFALEYALAKLWESWGVVPDVVMGHSVGELVAACVAGVFSLEDGLKLVAERGRLMQATSFGEMFVILASEAQVRAALGPYAQEVSIAAINGPRNVVISGYHRQVRQLVAELEANGMSTKRLTVSHAFHSPLMEPMLADFLAVARQISYSEPKIAFISNVTGQLASHDVSNPAYWVRHVRQAVRFQQGMASLVEQGATVFVEIGPKPVLLGMGRRGVDHARFAWLPTLRQNRSDWSSLLSSVGQLYVRGVKIDWVGFDRDYARRKVELPTYPFQRERYWVETQTRRSVGSEEASLMPLLGKKLHSPSLGATIFESHFSTKALPFLLDHRVYEKVVVPGACHISLLLGASELTFPAKHVPRNEGSRIGGRAGCLLENVVFLQALVLSEEEGRTVQLTITPQVEAEGRSIGGGSFQIISFDDAVTFGEDNSWTVHATGQISTHANSTKEPPLLSMQEIKSRCQKEMTKRELYQALHSRQIQLGPSFQWIESIWRGNGEAIGQLKRPTTVENVQRYQLHPTLIDSCFHLLAVAFEGTGDDLFVPFSIEKFHFYHRGSFEQLYSPGMIWCYARQEEKSNPEEWVGDIQLFDHTGQVIAEVIGFEFRRANRAAFKGQQPSWSDWLYEPTWRPQVRFGLPAAYLPSPASFANISLESYPQRTALEPYLKGIKQLEEVSLSYVIQVFEKLGFNFVPSTRFSTSQLVRQLGIIKRYHRLCDRLLEMLAEEDLLRKTGNHWEVMKEPERIEPNISSYAAPKLTLATAEWTLLSRCGERLYQVLRGATDPLELLFPDGDLSLTTAIYQDSVRSQAMNFMVQQAVLKALKYLPTGRGIRILEIGAGTGGTTSSLLPHFDTSRTEYTFTDISPLFLSRAEEKFSTPDGALPFVSYKLLDIEKEPASQGFAQEQYDLILAANVLHATKDLRQTLTHIQRLMLPEGILVLLEGTTRQRWVDLTFGLTEGWWRFSDHDLRADYPLLSASSWQNLLADCGFKEAVGLSNGSQLQGSAVIVAQKAQQEQKPEKARSMAQSPAWLILADKNGVGQELARLLSGSGSQVILAFSDEKYQHLSEQSPQRYDKLTLRGTKDDFERLLKAYPNLHGVIHCWSLDTIEASALTEEGLRVATRLVCGSTLHLVQALMTLEEASPSLCLVTRGVQGPNGSEVAGSTLWGMGRVIAREHPELECVLIDLDPKDQKPQSAQNIFEELLTTNSRESEVVFREGVRLVGRLARANYPPSKEHIIREDASYLITGGLGGLGLRVARFLVEHGAQTLILVGRSDPKTYPEARSKEIENQLSQLEQAGAQVIVAQADVSQKEQLANVLAKIDQRRPLKGIIHSAGLLADGMLQQQSWERFEKVFAPKIQGAWNLHTLTQNQSLDFFVLFSSAAGLFGNPGQANYAAANTFLDALAHYRRSLGLVGLSIDWGGVV